MQLGICKVGDQMHTIGYEALWLMVEEDREEAIDILDSGANSDISLVGCLECRETMIFLKKYGKARDVTCPHCGTKQRVKNYKNGSTSIRRLD